MRRSVGRVSAMFRETVLLLMVAVMVLTRE
jgi:hypothetical protein